MTRHVHFGVCVCGKRERQFTWCCDLLWTCEGLKDLDVTLSCVVFVVENFPVTNATASAWFRRFQFVALDFHNRRMLQKRKYNKVSQTGLCPISSNIALNDFHPRQSSVKTTNLIIWSTKILSLAGSALNFIRGRLSQEHKLGNLECKTGNLGVRKLCHEQVQQRL